MFEPFCSQGVKEKGGTTKRSHLLDAKIRRKSSSLGPKLALTWKQNDRRRPKHETNNRKITKNEQLSKICTASRREHIFSGSGAPGIEQNRPRMRPSCTPTSSTNRQTTSLQTRCAARWCQERPRRLKRCVACVCPPQVGVPGRG